jgi:DNA invertase Pin-like site-specific DNA recombinase
MKDGRITRAAIYERVSTDDQTVDNQLRELRMVAERNGWEIIQEFIDKGISGVKGREHRPAFDALWKGAIRREFDVVMVWAVHRLGRSLSHLVNFLSEIHAKKVDLFIHQQGIDTTTPAGKTLFGVSGIKRVGRRANAGEDGRSRKRIQRAVQDSRTQTTRPRNGSHRQTDRSQFENSMAISSRVEASSQVA